MNELNINIPGYTIACKTYGNTSNPPMIALHGWLDNANSFDLIAPWFGKYFYLIAIDLPGHGLSTHLPVGCHYHFIDSMGIVKNVMDALRFKQAHIMGHSMGAGIASLIGGVLEPNVLSLFLIEGLGPLSSPEDQCNGQLRQYFKHNKRDKHRYSKPYANLEEAITARSRHGYISEQHAAILCQRGIEVYEGQFYWRHDGRLLHASPLRLTEAQTLDCLKQIKAQTALITATNGFGYDEDLMKNRIKTVKHIQTFKIEGGHHVHMEKPDAVCEAATLFYGF